jgi:hypothetical protein
MMRKSKCVFSLGFCSDWVEVYQLKPRPKDQGEYLFAFRKKSKRKVFPLMTGLTMGGVEVIIKSLTRRPGFKLSKTLTQLCLAIGEKMGNPHFTPVLLP